MAVVLRDTKLSRTMSDAITAAGGGNNALIMNIVKMEPSRCENHKLNLPANINGMESDTQRAVIFHAAAGKLEAASKHISPRGRIERLAEILAVTHTCEKVLTKLENEYEAKFFDPQFWVIKEFLDHKGSVLTNSTTTANSQILKILGDPLVSHAANARRQPNISFVQIQAEIKLDGITGDAKHKITIESTISLPKSTTIVQDGAGNDVEVYTFAGEADIRTYTPAAFKTEILDKTGQKKPASLQRPAFGAVNCTLDEDTKDEKFRDALIELCWKFLKDQLFKQCCPGVAFRPSSALALVQQVIKDSNGNPFILPMTLYFTNLRVAMNCMGREEYETDVVRYAVDNMAPQIKDELESAYDKHREPRARDWMTQSDALDALLHEAIKAEKKVQSTMRLVDQGATRVLTASFPGAQVPVAASASTGIHASVAETTLKANQKYHFVYHDGDKKCFGCGQDHPWRTDGVVTCPNAKHAGVAQQAQSNFKLWRENRWSGKGGKAKGKGKPRFGKLLDNEKKGFVNNLLGDPILCQTFNSLVAAADEANQAKLNASSNANATQNTGNNGGNTAGNAGIYGPSSNAVVTYQVTPGGKRTRMNGGSNVVILAGIPVFNVNPTGAPPLPVSLNSNLPHIALAVGTNEQDNEIIHCHALMDTGAGAIIGYYDYMEAVVARCPTMLANVYSVKDGKYSSITMHGIVDEMSGSSATTRLPIAFEIRTPYVDREGREIHIMVGLGSNVSVNLILSNDWFKKMKAVIDYPNDEVRIPMGQDTHTFPITYFPPKKSVPEPGGSYSVTPQEAWDQLPQMESFLKVMVTYNPRSPRLDWVSNYVKSLRVNAATTLPEDVRVREGSRLAHMTWKEHQAAAMTCNGVIAPPAPQPPARYATGRQREVARISMAASHAQRSGKKAKISVPQNATACNVNPECNDIAIGACKSTLGDYDVVPLIGKQDWDHSSQDSDLFASTSASEAE